MPVKLKKSNTIKPISAIKTIPKVITLSISLYSCQSGFLLTVKILFHDSNTSINP